MRFDYSWRAAKFIRSLQKSDPKSAKIVIATIEDLAKNPAPMGSKKTTKHGISERGCR